VVDSRDPQRIFAGGPGGLFQSTDAGQTWQAMTVVPIRGGWMALTQDPRRPLNLYAATTTGVIYRSRDGGASWRAVQ
jgi:photosystem II stability/assembly factor-like uncharacterized protein